MRAVAEIMQILASEPLPRARDILNADCIDGLIRAATKLRNAQRNYMADRGNPELGKLVGQFAAELDQALELFK